MAVGTATTRPGGPPPPGLGLLGEKAALVPVKAFADAKQRLGVALSDVDRQALVRRMAARVLAAAAPLAAAVVCDDTEVAAWARDHGALVVWEPGRGLNGAVEAGVTHLAAIGVRTVVVAHGDLPRASGLATLGDPASITLVPDRHDNGTNVIALPAGCGFRFSYGPGSFARHRAECERLRLPYHVVRPPGLAFDVDLPTDLEWA